MAKPYTIFNAPETLDEVDLDYLTDTVNALHHAKSSLAQAKEEINTLRLEIQILNQRLTKEREFLAEEAERYVNNELDRFAYDIKDAIMTAQFPYKTERKGNK